MKHILVIHLNSTEDTSTVSFAGREVEIQHVGCAGDAERARALIAEADGQVDAIGLEGIPSDLQIGEVKRRYEAGAALHSAAQVTPVVDGGGVRPGLERWGVILADRAQPGIFAEKRILMVPGLNHDGLAQALARHSPAIRYADPLVYFALPALPGVGSRQTLEQAAPPTLEAAEGRAFPPPPPAGRAPGRAARHAALRAGPMCWPATSAPSAATRPPGWTTRRSSWNGPREDDLADLQRRGVSIAVTLMPSLEHAGGLGRWSAATIEAVLVALRGTRSKPLTEDTYLDLIADLDWRPHIRYLQPDEAGINRFAFVIHPLDVGFIDKHPPFRWTRYLPAGLVENSRGLFPAHVPFAHQGRAFRLPPASASRAS